MPLFLGHRTAELLLEKPEVDSLSPSIDQGFEHCWASRSDLNHLNLSLLDDIPRPFDVLVSSPREMRRWENVSCHLCQAPLPSGAFLQLAQDVFVASPALCLIQRAQELSLARTVVLADRFCGTYALSKNRLSGIRERRPIATQEELLSFIDRCSRIKGIARAQRAATLTLEGSASPMESISRLVFCLPRRLGGYGLSLPQMNYEITLSSQARRIVGKDFIRIDLYWKEFGFGIEYQGKLSHSTLADISDDIARQLAARRMGIELQFITIGQIRDREQRMEVARLIAGRIGESISSDRAFQISNQQLVNELIPTRVA